MFKKAKRIRSLITEILVVVLAVLSLVLFTACQNNNAGNTTNGNDNNMNDSNINDNGSRFIYATVGDNKLEIELSQNVATSKLIERLRDSDITYTARDYGGFEKVGNIGISLYTNDAVIQAEAGDVMLYQGNQIVMFYGNNRYSYTRIGRIRGLSSDELRSALNAGNGDIQVTLSLG